MAPFTEISIPFKEGIIKKIPILGYVPKNDENKNLVHEGLITFNNFNNFLNTIVNTFLYYFQNIVLIHSFHYKFENERNIRHKSSSIIQHVNNITDMHVIYNIACW